MTIKSLVSRMNSICPVRNCKVNDFPSKLKEKLYSYREELESLEFTDEECDYSKGMMLRNVDKLIEAINETIEQVYLGKPADAYKKLSSLLSSLGRHLDSIEEGHSFYRMRSAKGPEKNKIGYKDMFHIPFDKRGIVTTQRFSTPGYPCLYLGEHSYGCWEELGQPDLDSCLVSRLKNTRSLKLWDLRIPSSEDINNPLFIGHSIMSFPLVIACMFKVDDSNISFKPEYIIPQMLLQSIIDSHIDGIIYTSVHKNKIYGFYDNVFTNYVIPIKQYNKDYSHCPQLCETFSITKPTCEEYLKIQHGSDLAPDFVKFKPNPSLPARKQNGYFNYRQSLFGYIENWLDDESYFKLNKIKPSVKKSNSK